jgi:hypothetical protein
MVESNRFPGLKVSANLSGIKITLECSSERAGHAVKVLAAQGQPFTRNRFLTKRA